VQTFTARRYCKVRNEVYAIAILSVRPSVCYIRVGLAVLKQYACKRIRAQNFSHTNIRNEISKEY